MVTWLEIGWSRTEIKDCLAPKPWLLHWLQIKSIFRAELHFLLPWTLGKNESSAVFSGRAHKPIAVATVASRNVAATGSSDVFLKRRNQALKLQESGDYSVLVLKGSPEVPWEHKQNKTKMGEVVGTRRYLLPCQWLGMWALESGAPGFECHAGTCFSVWTLAQH